MYSLSDADLIEMIFLLCDHSIWDGAGWGGSEHPVSADEEAVELAVHWKHSEDHQTPVWDTY